MSRDELRKKVIEMYKKAFSKGTDAAWKTYRRNLKKLAVENDASSPEALEDWALNF